MALNLGPYLFGWGLKYGPFSEMVYGGYGSIPD